MNIFQSINAAQPFPDDHDKRMDARMALANEVSEHLREIMEALPDDEMRREVMIGAAVCLNCGHNYRHMYETRRWYTCDCFREI